MTRDELIRAIEGFADAHGIAPATVTSRAVGNSRLYRRLKDGGDCTTEVLQRVVAHMNEALQNQRGAA